MGARTLIRITPFLAPNTMASALTTRRAYPNPMISIDERRDDDEADEHDRGDRIEGHQMQPSGSIVQTSGMTPPSVRGR
jgi:hypothetical protein